MGKVIIGIHGLANKPEEKLLKKWWKRALIDGLRDRGCVRYNFKFELVYWADLIYEKPLDPNISDSENSLFLDEPYITHGKFKEEESSNKMGVLFDELIKDLILNKTISIKLSSLYDKLLEKFFKELHIYFSHLTIKTGEKKVDLQKDVRNRLSDLLKKYKNDDILLIAHSMGSIIAYDVLNVCSSKYSVDTLITIGSPLGIPYIVNKLKNKSDIELDDIKMRTPDSIKKNWFNFADESDKVGMNINFEEYYDKNELNVVAESKGVVNRYSIDGRKNPHKSYGYLRTLEVSEIINSFLTRDESKIYNWIISKSNKTFDIFANRYMSLTRNKIFRRRYE